MHLWYLATVYDQALLITNFEALVFVLHAHTAPSNIAMPVSAKK